jgi:hypothetical protein
MQKFIVVGTNGLWYVAEFLTEFDCYQFLPLSYETRDEALEVRNALT